MGCLLECVQVRERRDLSRPVHELVDDAMSFEADPFSMPSQWPLQWCGLRLPFWQHTS